MRQYKVCLISYACPWQKTTSTTPLVKVDIYLYIWIYYIIIFLIKGRNIKYVKNDQNHSLRWEDPAKV